MKCCVFLQFALIKFDVINKTNVPAPICITKKLKRWWCRVYSRLSSCFYEIMRISFLLLSVKLVDN